MNNCRCNQTINPDDCLNYWSVSCSVPYYTKAEIDKMFEELKPCGCCPTFSVDGTTLVIDDGDECVWVDGTTLVIGE